jgi:ferric-dicitrate binding protein FerR (iron transport regulator)
MNCDHATELLCARLAGELPAEERLTLETHLESCSACRAVGEAFQTQDAELREAFAPRRQTVAALAERVITQVRAVSKPRRRFPVFWIAPLLSAAAGFLLAVGIFRPWEKPTVQPITIPVEKEKLQLTLTTGPIEVKSSGEDAWRPLEAGAAIDVGTCVRTPKQYRCEVRTADGSEVRLNTDTEVAFHSGRQLDLVRGQILATVAPAPDPFAVGIDQAKVTALGTQFDLWRQPAETRLAVLQGATEVDGQGPRELVKTGEVAKIVGGRVEEKSPAHDLVAATRWVNELFILKSRSNPELGRRVDDLLAQLGDTKTSSMSEVDIRALGDHCVLPLTRFIQSDRSKGREQRTRRVEAARILGDLAQPWSIPDLIKLLDDEDADVRYFASLGLRRLTRETLGCEPNAWRDQSHQTLGQARERWQGWWEEHKDRYPKPP